MRHDRTHWEAWEKEYHRKRPPDYLKNLQIFEALYREALSLGVLPPSDPLRGIEEKIRFARSINVSRNPQKDRTGI
jgi:hypothetical protein